MLKKILFTFLVGIITTVSSWQIAKSNDEEKLNQPFSSIEKIRIIEQNELPDTLNHVRFSARDNKAGFSNIEPYKETEMKQVLTKLPTHHFNSLKNIVLDLDPKAHRGLGGSELVIIRSTNIDTKEFYSVLIHELGHTTDLGSLRETESIFESEFSDNQKPIYEGDPSLIFYRINWENEITRKRDSKNEDFVSGYAITDPFEDFAESYVYYVLHNKEFKMKARYNRRLMEKYLFMKYDVFNGQEFNTGEEDLKKVNIRPWDITKLNYNLEEFLAG